MNAAASSCPRSAGAAEPEDTQAAAGCYLKPVSRTQYGLMAALALITLELLWQELRQVRDECTHDDDLWRACSLSGLGSGMD